MIWWDKKSIEKYRDAFFRSTYDNRIEIFFKGWYAFVLVKLALLGPLFNDLMQFHQLIGGSSIAGARMLIIFVMLLGIMLKRNYFLSILMFVVTLWAHRIIHPVVNGGDLVVLFFMFLGIFCNTRPEFSEGSSLGLFQTALSNFSILMGKVQVTLIYLVSGWDKLTSQSWRDGSSLFNLLRVDYYPANWVGYLTQDISLNALVVISWLVILFELWFPLMLWFPKWRYSVLATGVIFHLLIGIGLSLPDFALVMIWCYLLFLDARH